MAGVLSQLEAFVKNNWCALLVGTLVLCYVYYSHGRNGMTTPWKSTYKGVNTIINNADVRAKNMKKQYSDHPYGGEHVYENVVNPDMQETREYMNG